MLCYCKKCGRVVQEVYRRDEQICDYCNSILEYIPKQFLIGKRGIALNDELKQQFIDEYIKSSPEFDQFLFEHRDEDLSKRRMENKAKLERGKAILEEQACQPECPTCHSKNVQPISGVEHGASIIGLGIFSKKINKSYKCKHCGYTW